MIISKKRFYDLAEIIKSKTTKYYYEIYNELIEMHSLGLKIFPNFSISHLSMYVDMSESTLRKILSFKKANTKTKERISKGEITLPKAMLVLSKIDRIDQDKYIGDVIKNKIKYRQIEEMIDIKKSENIKVLSNFKEKVNYSNDEISQLQNRLYQVIKIMSDLDIPSLKNKKIIPLLKELKHTIDNVLIDSNEY